jgi:UTP-glucose-1-phosphate uridylyltransferase
VRTLCSVVLCTSSCQVTIVVQDEQLGLGHAVLCAGPHMTGDPMLLMLGDHIYRSTHEQGTSCVRQHVWHANLGILGRAASCGHAPRVAMLAFPIAA